MKRPQDLRAGIDWISRSIGSDRFCLFRPGCEAMNKLDRFLISRILVPSTYWQYLLYMTSTWLGIGFLRATLFALVLRRQNANRVLTWVTSEPKKSLVVKVDDPPRTWLARNWGWLLFAVAVLTIVAGVVFWYMISQSPNRQAQSPIAVSRTMFTTVSFNPWESPFFNQ